jgi:Kdo2-lipid IVA lauroyltransferase/acyltransferase
MIGSDRACSTLHHWRPIIEPVGRARAALGASDENNPNMRMLLRAMLGLMGKLPLPLLHGAGWLLGNGLWLLPNRFRALTQWHIRRCLPALDVGSQRRIARRSLIESAKALCEAPAIWFGSARRLRRWLADPAALAVLRQVHAGGRGVIMLTPHLGAWELTSFFCSQIAPITVLYKPQKGASDAVIRAGRGRWPTVQPVPTSGGGVKATLAALKRGALVGLLPDHDPPEDSGTVFAPLFGMPANTMALVAKLAARSGAPVWFIAAERLSWGRGFRIHLRPAPRDIADPVLGAAALNTGVEACIREWPEQYWWSYRRYRRQPPGAPDFYAGL